MIRRSLKKIQNYFFFKSPIFAWKILENIWKKKSTIIFWQFLKKLFFQNPQVHVFSFLGSSLEKKLDDCFEGSQEKCSKETQILFKGTIEIKKMIARSLKNILKEDSCLKVFKFFFKNLWWLFRRTLKCSSKKTFLLLEIFGPWKILFKNVRSNVLRSLKNIL